MKNYCLLLHGFPGRGSKKMLADIASAINDVPSTLAEVVSYPGLHNKDALFGFHSSFESVFSRVQRDLADCSPENIFFIGHSFGALMSLLVAKKLALTNVYLILLAPMTHVASPEQPFHLIQAVHEMYPDQFPENRLPELVEDLKSLIATENFTEGTSAWLKSSNLTFVLGLQDTVFTKAHHQEFLKQFTANDVAVNELDDDHSFSKKPARLIEIFLPLLK